MTHFLNKAVIKNDGGVRSSAIEESRVFDAGRCENRSAFAAGNGSKCPSANRRLGEPARAAADSSLVVGLKFSRANSNHDIKLLIESQARLMRSVGERRAWMLGVLIF